jgi:phospholipase D1/2
MGQQIKQRFRPGAGKEQEPDHPQGISRVQVIRSVSQWSHGVPTERSIQNACEIYIRRVASLP